MESEKINEIKNIKKYKKIISDLDHGLIVECYSCEPKDKILKIKDIKEYKADYYIKNKKKVVCEICEGIYEPSTKARHNKSIKHYNALNPDTQKPKRTNKDKLEKIEN